MRIPKYVSLAVAGAALVWIATAERNKVVLKPVEELKIRITSSTDIPDPAKIDSAGQWYYLDHISSGLAAFDSEKKKFVPRLAESWHTKPDGAHIFRLAPGARFHDGTPITTKDVIWSIKRQLILKTSTHFPLWDYISGCDQLKSLNDECAGLKAISDSEIAIHLKAQTDSFFLQLASPETGIWSAEDMDPATSRQNFPAPTLFRSTHPLLRSSSATKNLR
jgi:ABC-type transport system substrate-binding protein